MLNCPTPKQTQKRYMLALPDLRFYPLALRVEVPDEQDPMKVCKLTFHKVTGPSAPHTLKEAGLATSLAALPLLFATPARLSESTSTRRSCRACEGKQAGRRVTSLAAPPWPFATSARLSSRTSRAAERLRGQMCFSTPGVLGIDVF